MTLPNELKPRDRLLVIDLVREAGIDVSDWSNYRRSPGANPKYCYDWAFIQPGKVLVLNLWYDSMHEENSVIEQRFNLRTLLNNETINIRRARYIRMEKAIKTAYQSGLPVRVIVLDGIRRNIHNNKPASVKKRILDPVRWAVKKYDVLSGDIVVRRGEEITTFVDQFSIVPPDGHGNRREVKGSVIIRDAAVRNYVLNRAVGKCEICGAEGFKVTNGRIYLETHHIVPLSENGPDSVVNMGALCPNHHREIHYGIESDRLKTDLLFKVENNTH